MVVGGFQPNPDRHKWDDYPTEPEWTYALLDNVKLRGKVWEPAAGEGKMVRVLVNRGYRVRATDIRFTGRDFLAHEGTWEGSIVTNPPYKHLDEFIKIALASATEQVAFLLAVHALGGKKRNNELWAPNPPNQVVFVPRLMHVNGKSSQFFHAWVVWDKKLGPGETSFAWGQIPDSYGRREYMVHTDDRFKGVAPDVAAMLK